MRYDGIGIGANDLAFGVTYLKKLEKEFGIPLVNANIMDKKSATPLFNPFIIKKAGNRRIGITGIADPDLSLSGKTVQSITLVAWDKALGDVINLKTEKHDFLILLSSLAYSENRKIARKFPQIDLIIMSSLPGKNMSPLIFNNSLVCQSGYKGKFFGVLDITWNPSGKWQQDNSVRIRQKKSTLTRLNQQINHIRQQSKPSRSRQYEALVRQRDQILSDIDQLSGNTASQASSPGNTFENRFISLKKSFPDDLEVLKVVEQAKNKVNRINFNQARRSRSTKLTDPETDIHYVGWKKCARCHGQQVMSWNKSSHAGAYKTLQLKNQHSNLECLPCHVTGISRKNPSMALQIPQHLKTVGCEVCHGAAANHIDAPDKHKLTNPAASLCKKCHTPEQDDSFKFAEDVKKLHCSSD